MNILFFSRALPCHGTGGMERVAWDVATGMAERGHTVKIITTARPEGHCPDTANPANIDVEHLESARPGHYSSRWWQESRGAFLRAKNAFKPDLVFSVSAGAKAVFPLINGIPAVMQAHGTLLQEMHSKVRSGNMLSSVSAVHNLMKIPQDLLMYRRVQRVIAVGPSVYNSLLHPLCRLTLSEKKVVMIPNGIDTALFKADPAAGSALRRRLGIPGNAKVLVTASRLHRQKGIHFALAALARLKTDVWFLVAGDGPEMDNLRHRAGELGIDDRVRFVGRIPHEKLPHYLSAGNAFVLTSTWNEGLPLGVLEAMSVNLPSIITRRLATALDVPTDTRGIYCVDPEDAEMTSVMMQKAIDAGDCDIRAIVETKYSRVQMLDRYEQTLKVIHQVAKEKLRGTIRC
jgi:glycosyltransferase involved in cell wall biosynthesis